MGQQQQTAVDRQGTCGEEKRVRHMLEVPDCNRTRFAAFNAAGAL